MYEYNYGKYTLSVTNIRIAEEDLFHVAVRPPMSDDAYDFLKYRIERAGGHWREKFGGFIFKDDPSYKLKQDDFWREVNLSAYEKWRIERQFFPTPPNVAKRVIELAEIKDYHTVLEPSAGKGGLINSLPNRERITAIEIDAELAHGLESMGYRVVNDSFENVVKNNFLSGFDRIVMNPPFSHNRDITHIMKAYELLNPGGILVAIMAENSLYYNTEAAHIFNDFIKSKNAYIEDVPIHSFESSDTLVDTVIVKIKK